MTEDNTVEIKVTVPTALMPHLRGWFAYCATQERERLAHPELEKRPDPETSTRLVEVFDQLTLAGRELPLPTVYIKHHGAPKWDTLGCPHCNAGGTIVSVCNVLEHRQFKRVTRDTDGTVTVHWSGEDEGNKDGSDEHVGYQCTSCNKPVAMPEDIEEDYV